MITLIKKKWNDVEATKVIFRESDNAESENDQIFSWLATDFAVQKYLIFWKKRIFFICFLYILGSFSNQYHQSS